VGEILKVLKGIRGPLEWLASGRAPVDAGLSAARAATCLGCRKNGSGPLTQWFTTPCSELIRETLEARHDFKMTTPYDAALGICEACYCPLKTKVHEPIEIALKHLKADERKELWENCWMLKEELNDNRTV